ncbi:MAG: hypothetical protein ACYTGN_09130 [Planctomycetota bacterium]|jgi:hypothetical protein
MRRFFVMCGLAAALFLGGCGGGGSDPAPAPNSGGGGASDWNTMVWGQGNWA